MCEAEVDVAGWNDDDDDADVWIGDIGADVVGEQDSGEQGDIGNIWLFEVKFIFIEFFKWNCCCCFCFCFCCCIIKSNRDSLLFKSTMLIAVLVVRLWWFFSDENDNEDDDELDDDDNDEDEFDESIVCADCCCGLLFKSHFWDKIEGGESNMILNISLNIYKIIIKYLKIITKIK